MKQSLLEAAWTASFGDLSDITSWEDMSSRPDVMSLLSSIPHAEDTIALSQLIPGTQAPLPKLRLRPTKAAAVIAPHIKGTPLDAERVITKSKRRHVKRPHPENLVSAPMITTNSNSAPISSPLCPSLTSILSAPPSSSFFSAPISSSLVSHHDEELAFIPDSFDTLISPQIVQPPNSTISNMSLRCALSRKQFQQEASSILHCTPPTELNLVENLIFIIH